MTKLKSVFFGLAVTGFLLLGIIPPVSAQTLIPSSIPNIYGSAISINNNGEVLISGSSDVNDLYTMHPILWKDGILLEIKDLGGWVMFEPTNSLNDKTEFIGSVYLNGKVRSFIHRPSSGIEYLPETVDGKPVGNMYVYALNNNSTVAGTFTFENDSCTHVFLWENGTIRRLDTETFTCSTTLTDINDNNVITGFSYPPESFTFNSFVYDAENGSVTVLAKEGVSSIMPESINNLGHIAGSYKNGEQLDRGFLLVNGTYTEIGTLGGTFSYAYSLNENDEVAGKSGIASDAETHAFHYKGGVMTDLGTLDYGDLPVTSTGSDSLSINNTGIIVGTNYSTDTQFSMSPVLFDYAVTKCKKPKKVQKDKDLPPPFAGYCPE